MAKPFQFPSDVPVIETERLILRACHYDDFQAFVKIKADPIVARFTSGDPLPEEEAWRKFLGIAGMWAHIGYGYWVVEDKASGACIGEAGFGDFKRGLKSSLDGMPEIGWILASGVHGKGFGSEAVAAIVRWGDENLASEKTCCVIDPENTPSVRLAEKFGYTEFARTKYKEFDVILYERLRRA